MLRGLGAAPSEFGRRLGRDKCLCLFVNTNAAAMLTESGGRYFELLFGSDVTISV